LLTQSQGSASDTPSPGPCRLTCHNRPPARTTPGTNCRQSQHHADDVGIRVTEQASGDSRAARLLQVIAQAGIGFRLARIWPGASKGYERQLKNSGGASRYCPICQQERKARGEFRRASRGRGQRRVGPSTRMPPADQARADGHQADGMAPTRRVRPEQAREFMALNPSFARPVGASLAKQWGRVGGREQIETLTPRVVGARFDENELLSQQRAAAVTKRAVQARVEARQRQLADQAERTRSRAVAARTRQRVANAQREHTGGRVARRGRSQPSGNPREGGHER
jgi:predicted DNA-binding WGR domain protein